MPPLEICCPGPGPLWPVRKYGPGHSVLFMVAHNCGRSWNLRMQGHACICVFSLHKNIWHPVDGHVSGPIHAAVWRQLWWTGSLSMFISNENTVEPLLSGLRLTVPLCCEQSLKKTEISMSFYKKWTIKDAIFSRSDCWNDIPSATLWKSRRKFHPDVVGDDLNGNEPEPQRDVRTTNGKTVTCIPF
jgi:hypothetical protein